MNALSPTRSAIEAGASNTAAARGAGGGATNSTDRSPRQPATAANTTPIIVNLANVACRLTFPWCRATRGIADAHPPRNVKGESNQTMTLEGRERSD
jgi:hypothetical protein